MPDHQGNRGHCRPAVHPRVVRDQATSSMRRRCRRGSRAINRTRPLRYSRGGTPYLPPATLCSGRSRQGAIISLFTFSNYRRNRCPGPTRRSIRCPLPRCPRRRATPCAAGHRRQRRVLPCRPSKPLPGRHPGRLARGRRIVGCFRSIRLPVPSRPRRPGLPWTRIGRAGKGLATTTPRWSGRLCSGACWTGVAWTSGHVGRMSSWSGQPSSGCADRTNSCKAPIAPATTSTPAARIRTPDRNGRHTACACYLLSEAGGYRLAPLFQHGGDVLERHVDVPPTLGDKSPLAVVQGPANPVDGCPALFGGGAGEG